MTITKELLQARRKVAFEDREKLLAQANAQQGAINAMDHLLAVLDLPDPVATNPQTSQEKP